MTALQAGRAPATIAQGWMGDMRRVAMQLFESRALPGLADRDVGAQARIVAAHRQLAAAFHGRGKLGRNAFAAMMLPVPGTEKEAA